MSNSKLSYQIAGAIALCFLFAPWSRATTVNITLDGNLAAPDYAFYSYTDTQGEAQNAIPIAPYITYLSGAGYNNTLVYTICYDINSPTNVGTSYSGQFAVLTDTATLEATYLVNKLVNAGLLDAPLAVRGALSLAIWEIMYPSSSTNSMAFPVDPAAHTYEVEAATAVTDHLWTAADSARYPTWIPDNPSLQRLGTILLDVSPATATPEPGTWALIGLGIFALTGYRRRWRH